MTGRLPGPGWRRGLLAGLAVLGALGIAILWTAWPTIRGAPQAIEHARTASGIAAALLPQDIASLAKSATVQIRAYDRSKELQSEGTGFFVSARGVLATNLHVIEDAQSLEIETLTGDVYDVVYFVTADARRDLAIPKVPADDAHPLALATGDELETGERVYVMGNPLGQTGTFSDGLVSARRVFEGVSLVQITAPVSPGSSGGPVMNAAGEVIGVTTLTLSGGQNLNYAIPVRYVRPLLASKQSPRRFARNLLPSSGSTAARSNRPGSAGTHGNPAGDRGTADAISARFRALDSLVRASGGEPTTDVMRGLLRERESTTHEVSLLEGREYLIGGSCDADCKDVDLTLHGPDGVVLASDVKNDDVPSLRFVAPADGAYELKVRMAACQANPCAYGIRLYRF